MVMAMMVVAKLHAAAKQEKIYGFIVSNIKQLKNLNFQKSSDYAMYIKTNEGKHIEIDWTI